MITEGEGQREGGREGGRRKESGWVYKTLSRGKYVPISNREQ